MAAKIIAVSADDSTYYTLPGSTGELMRQAGALEDTIFGQTFKSMQPGVIGWQIQSDAYFKGFPGYVCAIKKKGSTTGMTTEACTLVSGKTYQINATTKRVVDRAVTINVFDNAVNRNAEVLNFNYLTGEVTFKASYTVVGPVTITGSYFPMISLGKYTSFTLNQTAVAIKDSDIPEMQANGGVDTYRSGGLREVSLQLPAVFAAADAWDTELTSREEYIIEVNPDGAGSHVARGFFKLFDDKQNGNVGALEEETLQFNLFVPIASASQFEATTPFQWIHAPGGPIPNAVKTCLDAWEAQTSLFVKYLHDGTNGWKGEAVITNVTLQGGLDSVNQFTVSLQGSGERTDLP